MTEDAGDDVYGPEPYKAYREEVNLKELLEETLQFIPGETGLYARIEVALGKRGTP